MATPLHLLHGLPPTDLVDLAEGALQLSPLVPGAAAIGTIDDRSANSAVALVPPGTLERRYLLAHLLRTTRPGATVIALGPKDKGGSRIRKELQAMGCDVAEDARKHYRICRATRPEALLGIEAAIGEGAMRQRAEDGLWTQPGIFSWDRLDEGTALLLDALPPLAGHGADLGCGLGQLSMVILASSSVTAIEAVDLDRRAIEATRRNLPDARLTLHWLDVRAGLPFSGLDFIVMNPPFHSGGREDIDLGRVFLRQARSSLHASGTLWMVANRQLPYEAELAPLFSRVEPLAQSNRFKILRAVA